MLEVIEGKGALPRVLPPYQHGLFATTPQAGWEAAGTGPGGESNPTLVNNVETLSAVTHVLAHGADWYRSFGTTESPGTIVATVVGDVVRPGVAEVEMGTPLGEVIRQIGGGVAPGRRVKAVLPGVSAPAVTAEHLDVALTYEAFAGAGSGLGAAGFIVVDDTACMVRVAGQCSQFLAAASCGQCPSCTRGTATITALLGRIEAGVAQDGDLRELQAALATVTDGNRCFLPVEEQLVVASVLSRFADEVVAHLELGTCPRPRPVALPTTVRLEDLATPKVVPG